MKNMKNKKFLLLASHPDSFLGFRRSLILKLIDYDYQVYVVAPGLVGEAPVRSKLEEIGVIPINVKMSRKGMNPFVDLITLVNLFFIFIKIRPNYFMAYTAKPVIYGGLAAYFAGVKNRFSLITGLGRFFSEESSGFQEWFLKNMYKLSLPLSDTVFFQNEDDRNLFVIEKIIKRNKTVVVNGSGVDLNFFKFKKIDLKRKSFLFIGRLIDQKGIRIYVEAARKVKKIYPNAQFSVVGWIDVGKNSVQHREIEEWVEEGVINFQGKLSDVREALEECCVFILPSYYREGVPMSILEALAVGRPVITTDMPGCRETVEQGKNGFLIKSKSTDDLYENIIKFFNTNIDIEEMGFWSRRIAEKKFDVNIINHVMFEGMKLNEKNN